MNLINALMWMFYGALGIGDPLVWVPNMIGACLAIFQLILVVLFRRKSHSGSDVSINEVHKGPYSKFVDDSSSGQRYEDKSLDIPIDNDGSIVAISIGVTENPIHK